jgi:hypothetical protein
LLGIGVTDRLVAGCGREDPTIYTQNNCCSVLHGPRPLGWVLDFVIAISPIIVNIGHSSAGGTFEKDSNAKLRLDYPELKAELIVEGIGFPSAISRFK